MKDAADAAGGQKGGGYSLPFFDAKWSFTLLRKLHRECASRPEEMPRQMLSFEKFTDRQEISCSGLEKKDVMCYNSCAVMRLFCICRQDTIRVEASASKIMRKQRKTGAALGRRALKTLENQGKSKEIRYI